MQTNADLLPPMFVVASLNFVFVHILLLLLQTFVILHVVVFLLQSVSLFELMFVLVQRKTT